VLFPDALIDWLCGLSFICKGDDVLNALTNNGSHLSSFIKRAAICILFIEWYLLFFAYFNHCEAIPQPSQAEFIDPGKVKHEISDSTLMFLVSLLGQYQTAILVGLNESVQFRFECGYKNLAPIASLGKFVSGVGEKMIEIDGDQNQKQGRQGKLSDDDIIHIGFGFLFLLF
jgi:hypothetical protein